ncbi:LITAF-like zinc ribbon domain-containing protein [Ditylenchus destructor]|uniref:LITAF-like zinc ribbon domain-containing protein n=1 Tax=Ditylenchus destructor TaxID=166010 RepID=A0AAD4MNH8_9BILA|nr:LITAF-like zinc ribbon domain-containing protein [Ditylenchus destructor]
MSDPPQVLEPKAELPLNNEPTVVHVGGESSTVVTSQPAEAPRCTKSSQMGPYPSTLWCPQCYKRVKSNVEHHAGRLTWALAGTLCISHCWCCSPLPFYMDKYKDVIHTCPNCNAYLGRYKHI